MDDFSKYTWFYPLRAKSEFFPVFKTFQKLVENQFNSKIKVFQSDGGGEFMNHALKDHFHASGIKHLVSCPYTPEQNGTAERKHRHIVELGLTMLFHSNVPATHWVEAFFTSAYIGNKLPSSVLKDKSPYEVLENKKPDYSALRVFGSACYPCLRPQTDNKFDPRSLQCVFIGYHTQYKGYRCLHPPTGKVYISRHVIFDESLFPFMEKYKHLLPQSQTTLMKAWRPPSPPEILSDTRAIRTFPPPPSPIPQVAPPPAPAPAPIPPPVPQPPPAPTPPTDNTHTMTTRAKAGIHKPNTRYVLLASKFSTKEPATIAEAMAHPGWNNAVMEEIERIHMLHTWTLVPRTPDMNVIGSQWLCRTKLKPNGEVDKLKVRLVGKGNQQEEGLDYLETFSPVVRTATIRIVLNVAVNKGWNLKQLDVSNAFLHGELKEPVYMTQPQGFVDKDKPDYVCKLTKALYGLKQAPRAWFDTFSTFLIEFGFVCNKSDPSLFIYHKKGKSMVLLLYVDDILLTASDSTLMEALLEKLNTRFLMKDLGYPKYFLGIEIEQTEEGLFLHQSAYLQPNAHSSPN